MFKPSLQRALCLLAVTFVCTPSRATPFGSGSVVLPSEAAQLEAVRAADMELAAIGWRLASANVALCDRLEAGTGLQLHTLDQFNSSARESARAHFGFASPVAVEGVIAGSPADVAGIRADDSLLKIGPIDLTKGPDAPGTTQRLVAAQLAIADLPSDSPVGVELLRSGTRLRLTLKPRPVCRTRFELLLSNSFKASADGTMVQISSRYLENYSEEQVAALVAHEFSHNILRHRERLEARGVAFGVLSGFGKSVKYFRQTELQADLTSLYLLANAGYRSEAAPALWRKLGPDMGLNFLRDRSHPHWRDRVRAMEGEIVQMAKMSAKPIVPNSVRERDQPLSGDWQSLLRRGN